MNAKIPDTMRAAAIDRFGDAERITLQTLPVPKAGPDEIVIRVETAGVAVWDTLEREGGFAEMFGLKPVFPYVLGTDGAGTVAALGEQVTRFHEGDRVCASVLVNPKGGFYAEYAVANSDNAMHVPDKLTNEQAGVMLSDALTGLQGLDDVLALKRDETIRIFGAGGGIGHLAVQLAKRMGARVFAVASGDDGVALAQRLGADAVVNGRTSDVTAAARDFASGGLDAALLTAGGDAADRALASVRAGGRAAFPSGVMPEPKIPSEVRQGTYNATINRGAIEKLKHLIEAGPFEVHVARTFPLGNAAEAHRALSQHYLGKLALRVSA